MSRHERIVERAQGRCEYCRLPQNASSTPFQEDHIIAEKHGGPTHLDNLAWTCLDCNSYKGPNIAGYDHENRQTVRLFNPRTDSWQDHFEWDGPVLKSKTPIGLVTIDVLRINFPYRVAVRKSLMAEGAFRPD